MDIEIGKILLFGYTWPGCNSSQILFPSSVYSQLKWKITTTRLKTLLWQQKKIKKKKNSSGSFRKKELIINCVTDEVTLTLTSDIFFGIWSKLFKSQASRPLAKLRTACVREAKSKKP